MDPQYWTEGLVVMASATQQPAVLRPGKTSIRAVRKLERPRPLKIMPDSNGPKPEFSNCLRSAGIGELTAEDILQEVESVIKTIQSGNPAIHPLIVACTHLKSQGAQLEARFKDQLDRYFVAIRNACREENLDSNSRLHLLEIIELRAMGWRANENFSHYYKQKFLESEPTELSISHSMSPNSTPSITPSATALSATGSIFFPSLVSTLPQPQLVSALSPGEVLKSSGKFAKPTKIPGKNYYKDEIIIRNSDSGKVMGIKGRRVHMIEELSDTVISFQRVSQGAKDRLVQITGPTEDSITGARHLIEETIRRNASPVREKPEKGLYGCDSCSSLNSNNSDEGAHSMQLQLAANRRGQLMHSLSMNDATIGEYQYTVTVGKDLVRLAGAKLDLVRTAKLVLEEYFAGDALRSITDVNNIEEFPEHPYLNSKAKILGTTFSHCSMTSTSVAYGDDQFQGSGDRLIPVQQSPSSPDIRSYLECNGHQVFHNGSRRSSSSSSCEETFKSNEEHNIIYHDELANGFPEAEATETLPSLSAKSRRAQFAKTSDFLKDKESTVKTSSPPPPTTTTEPGLKHCTSQMATLSTPDFTEETVPNNSYHKSFPSIMYTRDFLLQCARSPFCLSISKELSEKLKEMPCIVKKNYDLFPPYDPTAKFNSYNNQDYMEEDGPPYE